MENLIASFHHQRKPTKKSKAAKTKPIKVVYISNPMKVTTCASKFRALVQELTGQDAGLPDPTKFKQADDDVTHAADQAVRLLDASKTTPILADDDDDEEEEEEEEEEQHALDEEVPIVDPCPGRQQPQTSDFSFEIFEDDFSKVDNFSGLYSSSSFFEYPQVDVLRTLDAM